MIHANWRSAPEQTHSQAPLKSELRTRDANYATPYLLQQLHIWTYRRIDLIIIYCIWILAHNIANIYKSSKMDNILALIQDALEGQIVSPLLITSFYRRSSCCWSLTMLYRTFTVNSSPKLCQQFSS
jgi:hypothetical protein